MAVFWIPAEGDMEFFSVCCAKGLMDLLGRKVEKGEELEIELSAKELT